MHQEKMQKKYRPATSRHTSTILFFVKRQETEHLDPARVRYGTYYFKLLIKSWQQSEASLDRIGIGDIVRWTASMLLASDDVLWS